MTRLVYKCKITKDGGGTLLFISQDNYVQNETLARLARLYLAYAAYLAYADLSDGKLLIC